MGGGAAARRATSSGRGLLPRSKGKTKNGSSVRAVAQFSNNASTLPSEFETMSPVGERCLVRVPEEESTTKSGIVLPNAANQRATAGEVVSPCERNDAILSKGQFALFSNFAGTDFIIGEDAYIVLREEDIFGTLPDVRADISQLSPLHDRILLRVDDPSTDTDYGLMLARESVEPPLIGEVKAKGQGKKRRPDDEDVASDQDESDAALSSFQIGNKVLYSRYAGQEYEGEDGGKWLVLRASEIEAIME